VRRFFTRLYGNETTKSRVGSAIISARLNHALLICGPDGSGKSTLATEIAAALNCEKKGDAIAPLPCGHCNNCRRIYEDNYPDIKRLKRDSSKATIGVEELRLFREDMFLSATESEHKIYVIEDAERMTPNAQNALLKVLEEPPEAVTIILLCEEGDKILTTIKSRAQLITMQRFSPEEIKNYLASKGFSTLSDKISEVVMSADGRIGRALEIIESPDEVEADRKIAIDVIAAMRQGAPYSELYSAVASLPQKRAELSEALELIMAALSDLVKIKSAKNAPLSFFSSRVAAQSYAEPISQKKLLLAYDALREASDENSKNANISALINCLGAKIKLI
jgi:DNA polymerase III delta' subunit